MSTWNAYPSTYRTAEISAILAATRAGECVSVVGLSGAGKSNLLGYLTHSRSTPTHAFALVDCNRLPEPTPPALFRLMRRALAPEATPGDAPDELAALDAALARRLSAAESSVCLALDLSLLFSRFEALARDPAFAGNLRALRDTYKYRLTYVTATRRPLPAHTEFAELFYAHTLWLGPLSENDARWTVTRYAERKGLKWNKATVEKLFALSGGYAALLRAACEAHAAGAALELDELAAHPAIQHRLEEFWADAPTPEELQNSRLAGRPLLLTGRTPVFDTTQLTAKENLLLGYFQGHAGAVCEKDDLIRAVWPEDKIFERGVRDDSLAQLVRRLREKIEPDAANPRHIQTMPGRGYGFKP